LCGGSLGEEDGFAFEADVEVSLDAGDYFGFERFDIGKVGLTAVDEGQCVAARDASGACAVAFDEAGVLEEPCSGEFDEGFACGPVGDFCGGDGSCGRDGG